MSHCLQWPTFTDLSCYVTTHFTLMWNIVITIMCSKRNVLIVAHSFLEAERYCQWHHLLSQSWNLMALYEQEVQRFIIMAAHKWEQRRGPSHFLSEAGNFPAKSIKTWQASEGLTTWTRAERQATVNLWSPLEGRSPQTGALFKSREHL